MKLTEKEYEVMEILWSADRPLVRAEIINLSPNKTWKVSTLHILLMKLLEKGAIEVDGITFSRNVLARAFVPTMSKDKYRAMMALDLPKSSPEDGKLSRIVAAMIDAEDVSNDTLDELQAVIDQKREKLSK